MLYRHLPDKAALIDGMVEVVFDEFQVPTLKGTDWKEQVRAFAATYRALVKSHPNLIVYLITHVEASAPAVLAVGEFLCTALHQVGLAPLQVVTATNLIIDYLSGFALGESSGVLGKPEQYQNFYALLHSLPAERYPTMRAIYGALDEATLQADHIRELELILAGIATWVPD